MPATVTKPKKRETTRGTAETNGHGSIDLDFLPQLRVPLAAGEAVISFSLERVGQVERWMPRWRLKVGEHEKQKDRLAVVSNREAAVSLALGDMQQHLRTEMACEQKNPAFVAIYQHALEELVEAEDSGGEWQDHDDDDDGPTPETDAEIEDSELPTVNAERPTSKGEAKAEKNPRLAPSAQADWVVQLVPLHLIAASPFQPAGRTGSDDAEIAELATSVIDQGLQTPIKLRPASALVVGAIFPDKKNTRPAFELLDGERRVRAAHRATWTTVRAIVVNVDDATASVAVGVANIQRKSWSALDKGAWLEYLTAPKRPEAGDRRPEEEKKGKKSASASSLQPPAYGLGLSQAEAGKLAGGISQGEVSNLIRIHQGLKGKWRQRVISGEMEPTKARLLLPYLEHAEVAKALEKSLTAKDAFDRLDLEAPRENFRDAIGDVLRKAFRQTDHEVYAGGHYVRLTEKEIEQHAGELGLATVPATYGAAERSMTLATNRKKFDELIEAKAKQVVAKKTRGRDAAEAKAADSRRQETPAERRAEEKKQAEQLAGRIADWRRKWIRKLLREEMEASGDAVLGTCGAWLFAHAVTSYGSPAKPQLIELAVRGTTSGKKHGGRPLGWADFAGDENGMSFGWQTLAHIVGELVWPSRDEDRVHPSGSDALYHIPDDVLEGLAIAAKIDLATCWEHAQACKGLDAVAAAEERQWISGFLDLFNREQLVGLVNEARAAKWTITSRPGEPLKNTTRSELQAAIEAACFASPLPLPKSLAPLKAPREKARKK